MKLLHQIISIFLASSLANKAIGSSIVNDVHDVEMSRIFVQYQPGHKVEVASTLGVGASAVLIDGPTEVHYDFKKLETFVVSVPTASLEVLRDDPHILLVEEDHRIFPIGIDESTTGGHSLRGLTAQTVPYGVDMVEARDVWDANRDGIVDAGAPTGANRKICIIDSGFLATHEDLQGINVTGHDGDFGPWNQDGDGNVTHSSDGHGTHVAGMIAYYFAYHLIYHPNNNPNISILL